MKKLKKEDINSKKQSSRWAKNDFSVFLNCSIINSCRKSRRLHKKIYRRASKVWALLLWAASAIESCQSAAIAWRIYFQPFHTIISLHLYFLSIIPNLQLFTYFIFSKLWASIPKTSRLGLRVTYSWTTKNSPVFRQAWSPFVCFMDLMKSTRPASSRNALPNGSTY